MPQNARVIRPGILASDEVREVADLAYDLWLANGFRGGTPEEAPFNAVRHFRRKTSAGLFLVPNEGHYSYVHCDASFKRKAVMKTILVLEDESSLMMLLRHMLRQYNLMEAATAEQALCLFREHGRQIDLLVADVTLPARSGIQVALLLRIAIPDLPVILTSGYPVSAWSDRDSADLERLGSRSVTILPKPFRGEELSTQFVS